MHMRDLISSTRIAIQTSIQLATDRAMIGLRVDGRALTQYGPTTLEEAERTRGRPPKIRFCSIDDEGRRGRAVM
jgi:hypothetical protein